MQTGLQKIFLEILLDGNNNYIGDERVTTIVGGDGLEPAISAASIVAKVARDNYMSNASLEYPGYYFEKHVGYGTTAHAAALKLQGICELHRRSFAPVRATMNAA